MPDIILVDQSVFQHWIMAKQKPEAFEEELLKKGFDDYAVKATSCRPEYQDSEGGIPCSALSLYI